jgi:DNA processing protein
MSTDVGAGGGAVTSELAARLALLSLPGIGPARSRWLLAAASAPEVVEDLRRERLPATIGPAPTGVTTKLIGCWAAALRKLDLADLMAEVLSSGDEVVDPAHPRWPFHHDPDPPALLFLRGDLGLLDAGAVVAVVGTRRCSTIGRQVAFELGAELSEHGVVVVSGLASGVDGAAHRGVLAAGGRPLGVVGTGLDVVYPAVNRDLWRGVAEHGLLVSEAPPGTKPERWRFPARNRLLAALAQAVVIVESHDQGGSLHTVTEALDRGREVFAVPGAVTNPAAAGTNRLLVEGCPPARSAADVLDALALGFSSADADVPTPRSEVSGGDAPMSSLARRIVTEATAGSVHLDDLIALTRAPIPELLSEVNALAARGVIRLTGSTVSINPRGHGERRVGYPQRP